MALTDEIAAAAARRVVEDGMEYGPAKQKAARTLGRRQLRSGDMPSNEAVEDEIRSYVELFLADTQPAELLALRRVALMWMERLEPFRPHLSGAAWRGTATRQSAVHIDLYCDDPKSAEIALLDKGVDFDVATLERPGAEPVDVLTVATPCPELGEPVTVHLHVRDLDEQRGALKPDAQGRTWRGNAQALRRLLDAPAGAAS